MANITITIPDDKVTRVVTALCNTAGLPVTNANAKKTIIDHIKATTLNYERKLKDETVTAQVRTIQATKETEIGALIVDIEAISIS